MDQRTLTLWQQSIPPGTTAETSVRPSSPAFSGAGKARLRNRRFGKAGGEDADFQLGEALGSGGMGIVYSARQTLFDRQVAVKMAKPGRKEAGAADALLAEAMVTGRLEHPNVVPVYDLGIDADGNLFYAMKELQGAPWQELMPKKSLAENLDILLRVADTVAFAHSRGILHRDIKPHNIMLGEFGEVMVMDWGASCPKPERDQRNRDAQETSLAGTPAYMPPEMAVGDTTRLGEASDVYLLGATLYHIITGHPPRNEPDPLVSLSLAADNHIEPAGEEGELLRIALKAMAANPDDRHPGVRAFQQAIRGYRSHSESLLLLENAKANLALAKEQGDYDLFNRAIYGFREALQLWAGNTEAEALRKEAVSAYARCAFENADFELALSLLDPANPAHREILDLINKAIRDRDAHKRRGKRLLVASILLGTALLILFVIAFFMVRGEHRKNLATLIAAHYGEQNYEATVADFWEYHDRYGMDSLDPETLLDVRVAANMNPWRGVVDTGIENPLRIMPSAESNCVWVVGEHELKKIRLQPEAGYDPATVVAIHDFKFGKRLPPGKIVESIQLPFALASGQAIHESPDGTLWAGGGSIVYRRSADGWNKVLDMGGLQFPPKQAIDRLPEGELAECNSWMVETGRHAPVTALRVNCGSTHATIALGGGVVCWVDMESGVCLGWFMNRFNSHERSSCNWNGDAGQWSIEPLVEMSSDERWLLYREGVGGTFAYLFNLDGFEPGAHFWGRDMPIRDAVFGGAGGLVGLADFGQTVFAPARDQFTQELSNYDFIHHGHWDTARYRTRQVPCGDWQTAALSPDGTQCLVATVEGELFAGSATNPDGFGLRCRIVGRKPVAACLLDGGTGLLLAPDGTLHAYDSHNYAIQALVLDGTVMDVCGGAEPGELYAVLAGRMGLQSRPPSAKVETGVSTYLGNRHLIRIAAAGTSSPSVSMLVPDTLAEVIACDPQGRYLAAAEATGIKIHDLRTGALLRTIPAQFGFKKIYDPENGNKPTTVPAEKPEITPMRFDVGGRYLLCEGRHHAWQKIVDCDTWQDLLAGKEISYTDIDLDIWGGQTNLLQAGGNTLCRFGSIAAKRQRKNPVWKAETEGIALSTIPFADPATGQRRYWCQSWYDRFRCFDGLEGTTVANQDRWFRKELGFPVFNENDPRVVLPLKTGRIEICLKTDLLPVFDPRILDQFKADRACLNSDASILAAICDGQLVLMRE